MMMPRGRASGHVVQARPDAQRTPHRCPAPSHRKDYKKRSGILPHQPFITKFLLYFPTIPGETVVLVIVTHIPYSGRTECASSPPLRHAKDPADPERMLEHRVERGFAQCPAHPLSRGHDSHRGRCTLGARAPACPPVSSAAACRTAPCRPKATDLLTSALPHHQAPGALTPGWPCVAVITRVVSDRRGTPLPGRHVRSRRACTPSDVCAHGLLYQPFTHLCRDVTPSWGVHRFRGITLAKTGRENLSRRGMDGREARHQRVHIYTGGSTPCNGSTRSDGRLAS